MTDYIKQLEPQIYYTRWQPTMSLQTIAHDSEYISQLADQNLDESYVVIVDMTDNKDFAMDLKGLTEIARLDDRIIGYVFIKGDSTAKFLGGMLKHLSKHDFKFLDTYDDAFTYAQNLLIRERA